MTWSRSVGRFAGAPIGLCTTTAALAAGLALSACRAKSDAQQPLAWHLPARTAIPSCAPDTARRTAVAAPRPGRYVLTMIETSGNEIGRRIDGKLWLARTSATDSSSRTGARPPKPDTLQYPLYGAVDIALDSISAHASGQSGPTSIDPIFPGVLAILWDQGGDGPKQPFLLIGTNDNRRDGNIDVDGEGIALNTLERTDSGFAGVWGPFGLRKTGAGYFCAHAVRE